MNLITMVVVIAVVATMAGFVFTKCNCKLTKGNEVLVKAFFPWTFNKRVKEYKIQVEAERRTQLQVDEEARIIKQQANKAKKFAVLRTIELGNDSEQNAIIKRYNDTMIDYAENWHNIDVQHFEWLQHQLNSACYEALNKLMLARQNHNKVMEFHCA